MGHLYSICLGLSLSSVGEWALPLVKEPLTCPCGNGRADTRFIFRSSLVLCRSLYLRCQRGWSSSKRIKGKHLKFKKGGGVLPQTSLGKVVLMEIKE